MKQVLVLAPFILALPLVIGAAIWQGNQSERWGTFPEMRQFAARLDKLPLVVGDWKGQKQDELAEGVRKYAGAEGDNNIVYTNSRTGETVGVFAVCGRLIDVWNHRPDRCYPAGGYELEGEMTREPIAIGDGKTKAEFETASFVKKGDKSVKIYWTWSNGDGWHATEGLEDFRKHFSRTRPVFKVYFQTSLNAKNPAESQAACEHLIKDMLPVMDQCLFTDETPRSGGDAPANSTAVKPGESAKPAVASKQ